MICEAHVYVRYYSRKGREEPFYNSPQWVVGVLNRCGVGEFIVSSTCVQVEGIGIADILREAMEVKRLEGRRAYVFFRLWTFDAQHRRSGLAAHENCGLTERCQEYARVFRVAVLHCKCRQRM